MRIYFKRVFLLLISAVIITILLLRRSSNPSLDDDNKESSLEITYSSRLLAEINGLISEKSVISFKNFTSSIMQRFESSPKSCNIKFVTVVPRCSLKLKGSLINQMQYSQLIFFATETSIKFGGHWIPLNCVSDKMVVIVIPFRDRWVQLMNLLPVLHQLLQLQNLCYRILLVEQLGSEAFNKGRLNNAGFLEAISIFSFNCIIFHDVDLVPESLDIPYYCQSTKPLHMAVAVDTNGYRLPYSTLIGGVLAFTPTQYISANGYSNYYWGWGLEDDDMEIRLQATSGYDRLPESLARYKSTAHNSQRLFKAQKYRRKPLLSTATKRMFKDGLSNVAYDVVRRSNKRLYTHIIVDVGSQPDDFYDN